MKKIIGTEKTTAELTADSTDQETSVRLFIGIAPDVATQRFLDATAQHCDRLGLPRDCRWISHDNRHLTLAFLGDTDIRHLETVENILGEIATRNHTCYGQIVSTHPFPRNRAKMLASELLPTPELTTLQRDCSELMRAIGKQPERKTFRPHFTLARNRSGFARLPPVPASFTCTLGNLTLYESLLAPGGSQYRPLLSFELNHSSPEGEAEGQ